MFQQIFIFVLILFASKSQASISELYGFGSKSGSLAGASVSTATGPFSVFNNPAYLSEKSSSRFSLGVQWIALFKNFKDIEGVTTENTETSWIDRSGNVALEEDALFSQAISFSIVAFPNFFRTSLGGLFLTPLDSITEFDSGDPYLPRYEIWGSRLKKPEIHFALSNEWWDGFSTAIGASIHYRLQGKISSLLQGNTDRPSTLRIGGELKPALSPYFSWKVSKKRDEDSIGYSVGNVVRLPGKSKANFDVDFGARLFGDSAPLDLNFQAVSVLAYQPLTIDLGTTLDWNERWMSHFQLSYQRWKSFTSSTFSFSQPSTSECSGSPCGIQVSASSTPNYQFQDVWIPRVAQTIRLGEDELRVGYAYRRSAVQEGNVGNGNLIDPIQHQFHAGYGLMVDKPLGLDAQANLDFHGFLTHLVQGEIVKESAQKIGGPSYPTGGVVYGGSLSITLAFSNHEKTSP